MQCLGLHRPLIPPSDGAINAYSSQYRYLEKNRLWGRLLHACASTTEATRPALQNSEESLSAGV